ncbi:MAG: hypothetical protein LBQ03_00815 [Puniceicoccales bacterium]|nr:hypothetical protein [Puniceicoccales bacterium]
MNRILIEVIFCFSLGNTLVASDSFYTKESDDGQTIDVLRYNEGIAMIRRSLENRKQSLLDMLQFLLSQGRERGHESEKHQAEENEDGDQRKIRELIEAAKDPSENKQSFQTFHCSWI